MKFIILIASIVNASSHTKCVYLINQKCEIQTTFILIYILTKHISCECKCTFDGRKYNSYQWWNNDKCRCECKRRHICGKDYVWNRATCNCENGKYLAGIMDASAITCNGITESFDEITNFNGKKPTCKT